VPSTWPLQEVILLALRRDAADRYANARDFAQALRWARERSPSVPPAPRGSWVLDARPPKAPKPIPAEAAPVDTTPEPHEQSIEVQSTVLRVAPQVPGLEDELLHLGSPEEQEAPESPAPQHVDATNGANEDEPQSRPSSRP
jgi:hypothetical protein